MIIPIKDMESHLYEVIPPIHAQCRDADRLTIIDDASTDDTKGAARSLGVTALALGSSQGPYHARQIAASRYVCRHTAVYRRPLTPATWSAGRASRFAPLSRCSTVLYPRPDPVRSNPGCAHRATGARFQHSAQRGGSRQAGLLSHREPWCGQDRISESRCFRKMRSGGDSDICWRIQEEVLGALAVDPRVLMEREPRATMRELVSQFKRYGRGTASLRWVYGVETPTNPGRSRT